MSKYLTQLNKQQLKAVLSDAASIVVFAGPGTGKTKTLIAKLLYLLAEKKASSSDIAVITFTRAGAAEIKKRLQKEIGGDRHPFIGTFHALAYDIIAKHHKKLTIISAVEQKELVSSLIRKHPLIVHSKRTVKELIHAVSLYKNSQKKLSGELSEFVENYNKKLKQRGLVDYDDLLLLLHAYLKKYTSVRYSCVLVDEFQDVNDLQYVLIKKLLAPNGYLFLIGDTYQSIYGFRGINPKLSEQLVVDFPNIIHMDLVQTYRSVPEIVSVVTALVPGRVLVPIRKQHGEACIIHTPNEFSEANFIVSLITKRIGGLDLLQATSNIDKDAAVFSDFSILFRTRETARVLENILLSSGIPYQLIGAESPFAAKEIGFMRSVLTYLVEGKTHKNIDKLIQRYPSYMTKDTVRFLSNIMGEPVNKMTASHVIEQIFNACGFDLSAKSTRITHPLSIFFSYAVQFDTKRDGLAQFLRYLSDMEECEFYDKTADVVTLSTIHGAKGLEFRYVCVIGFEEGTIPYINKQSTQKEKDEELRLLYVAVSRARDALYLLQAKTRNDSQQQQSSFVQLFESFVQYRQDPRFEKLRMKKERELRCGKQQKLF